MDTLTADQLAEFVARANKAEALVASLKAALHTLKTTAETEEIEKLKKENEELARQVNSTRQALCQAEIRNKKVQVPLPGAPGYVAPSSNKSVDAPAAAPAAPAAAAAVAAAAEAPKAEKPKKEKAPKAEKPKAEVAEAAAPAEAKPIDISRLDFRVARIVTAERHPKAERLYVEDVETGEAKHRVVVSGLVEHVPIDQMQNRLIIICANLKPAKLMGVVSEAMVMCANLDGKVEILTPPEGSVPGDLVEFEGYPRTPDAEMNPKEKIFETVMPDLKTDANRVATYKGVAFTVKGKGVVTSPTLAGAGIK